MYKRLLLLDLKNTAAFGCEQNVLFTATLACRDLTAVMVKNTFVRQQQYSLHRKIWLNKNATQHESGLQHLALKRIAPALVKNLLSNQQVNTRSDYHAI